MSRRRQREETIVSDNESDATHLKSMIYDYCLGQMLSRTDAITINQRKNASWSTDRGMRVILQLAISILPRLIDTVRADRNVLRRRRLLEVLEYDQTLIDMGIISPEVSELTPFVDVGTAFQNEMNRRIIMLWEATSGAFYHFYWTYNNAVHPIRINRS